MTFVTIAVSLVFRAQVSIDCRADRDRPAGPLDEDSIGYLTNLAGSQKTRGQRPARSSTPSLIAFGPSIAISRPTAEPI
jgi:hypothetical protein